MKNCSCIEHMNRNSYIDSTLPRHQHIGNTVKLSKRFEEISCRRKLLTADSTLASLDWEFGIASKSGRRKKITCNVENGEKQGREN